MCADIHVSNNSEKKYPDVCRMDALSSFSQETFLTAL